MKTLKRKPRIGDTVRVKKGNLGAGSTFIVENVFKGTAGSWFVDLRGGFTYALFKIEVVI